MHVARFALRQSKVLIFVTIVLASLGVRSYLLVPQSIFPTMTFSKIDVVVEAGNLPPSRVRVAIAVPLEAALQALPSVTRVQATSSQGSAELLLTFAASTDPHVDLAFVNQAISQQRSSLEGATNVAAMIVDPNSEPVLSYALTSRTLSQAILREIAIRQIVPKLFGISGLGRLLVTAGPTVEYHVDLEPSSLASYRLGPADVVHSLADANAVLDVGALQSYGERHAVVVDSSLRDSFALAAIGVPDKDGAAIPIGALGRVALGVAPLTDQASYGGRDAVVINAYPIAGGDSVAMATEFRTRLATVVDTLPRSMSVDRFWDQTTLIVESQKSLRDAIFIGALLAVIVIFAFLRDVRLTLVAAAVIPVAMSIAVFGLQLAGQTLNLMSVGGLAVAVGLIIDDAIVVIEGIARTTADEPHLSPRDAIERTISGLAGAMAASTATTVVVFLPLGLLTGVTGFFFRALAFTLASSLVVSLGLALFIAPNIARVLFAGTSSERRRDTKPREDRLGIRYALVLQWALGNRAAIYTGSVVVFVVTFALLASLPTDFLPGMDEGQFEIAFTMPTGTSLAATDDAARAMARLVNGEPGVQAVGVLVGIDSNGYSPTPQNKGLLRVALVPEGGRPPYDSISERLRDRLQGLIPSAVFDFHQILEDLINDLSGTPAPIEIAVRGSDLQTLDRLASTLSMRIAKVPGIVDAASGVVYDDPTLRLDARPARLAALGLTYADLGDAVAANTLGVVATSVAGTYAQIPVRVRVRTEAPRQTLADATVFFRGGSTSIADVARVGSQTLVGEEDDENGQRIARVTANISGATLSSVTSGIAAILRSHPLPAGYSAEVGGQSAIASASFREFATVIAVAVALVFTMMLATFRSFSLPLVILTAIPLALIGVALALVLTHTTFNVSSFMGLLLLVGIVVKNGILLIDVANKRRAAGDSVETALLAAGTMRLRPIVMTTLAAIGGLLPLAFGVGQGSEMEKPLAIAVIGGLSTATIFTLLVIPVLYAAFAGDERPDAVARS